MAKLEFDDAAVTQIIHALDMMGRGTTEVADAMLGAAADVVVKGWRDKIVANKHVRSGTMRDSIKASKPQDKDGARVVEVRPTGTDGKNRKTPVRNAEKAFIINYQRPGDKWVQAAEAEAEADAQAAMRSVFDQWINSGNTTTTAGGWSTGAVTGGVG